jgi:predicted DCC family thiol-disulfide oxidoreductase YuxK
LYIFRLSFKLLNSLPSHIILFDGMCNLCSTSVQFVIKRDKKKRFSFASLQSSFGQQVLKQYNIDTGGPGSFILIKNGKAYLQSTGALLVAKELSAGWPLLAAFMIVPPFIRDKVYDFVSANRYRWFGRKTECWLPSQELRERFL